MQNKPSSEEISSQICPCVKSKYHLITLLIIVFIALPCWGGGWGEPPPRLHVDRWLSRGPLSLDAMEGGSVFVVEFWETTCRYCRDSIPFLIDLQRTYEAEGLKIVAVTSEDSETVTAFLEKQAETVNYWVAMDGEDRTFDAFQKALRFEGIPHSVVIDKRGRMVWDGHPKDGLDQVVKAVIDGSYDMAAARRGRSANKLIPVYFYLAQETEEDDLIRRVGQKILAYATGQDKILERFARRIIDEEVAGRPDLKLALTAARRAYTVSGGQSLTVLETYAKVLSVSGREKEASGIEAEARALQGLKPAEPKPEQ